MSPLRQPLIQAIGKEIQTSRLRKALKVSQSTIKRSKAIKLEESLLFTLRYKPGVTREKRAAINLMNDNNNNNNQNNIPHDDINNNNNNNNNINISNHHHLHGLGHNNNNNIHPSLLSDPNQHEVMENLVNPYGTETEEDIEHLQNLNVVVESSTHQLV